MKKKYYLAGILILFAAIATAQASHLASEIFPGNFSAGNFGFQGNLEVRKEGQTNLNINNKETNGREYGLASGSDTDAGRFSIYDKTADVERLGIDVDGNVDINGELKIGESPLSCNANLEGAIRYNSSEKAIEFCNGEEWCPFNGPCGSIILVISSSTDNYDIFVEAGSPAEAVDIEVTVNAGVLVGSQTTAQPALTTGNLPAGSTVKIINNGRIQGKGGNGGKGAANGCYACAGQGGENGGTALESTVSITIDNAAGEIWSGGGGGGGGRSTGDCYGWIDGGGGGGGGAGILQGNGATGSPSGLDGTSETGGAGGINTNSCYGHPMGGNGGKGGDPGQPGIGGTYHENWKYIIIGNYGAAGNAVLTNGNALTWTSQGDVRGPIS